MAVRFRVYEAGALTVDSEIEVAEAARRVAELTERVGSRPTVDASYTFGVKFVYERGPRAYVNGATVAELRDAYRAAQAAATVETVEPTAFVIADGTYTLVYGDDSYFTFRVRTARTGRLAGRRLVEFLSGPDNSLDFEAFGFVNEHTINVWRRFERGQMVNRAREIEAMCRNDRAALESAGLRYAERSSRCRNCNRVLTVPASLASGYGPDCAANLGIAYGDAEPVSGQGRTSRRRSRAAEATVETSTATVETETDCPRCGDPLDVCDCVPVQAALSGVPTGVTSHHFA